MDLRKLVNLNKALLGKQIWRFCLELECVWKRLISLKYGLEDRGRKSRIPKGDFGVSLWKEIMEEAVWVGNNLEFCIGNGNRVRFWLDH